MGTLMDNNSAESVDLIERAMAGDREALNALFARHRDRLRRMVEMRLDTRLQARLDASDVVQEAYVEVIGRLEEYLPRHPLSGRPRRLGRGPGSLRRGDRAPGRVPARPQTPPVPLAAPGGRRTA